MTTFLIILLVVGRSPLSDPVAGAMQESDPVAEALQEFDPSEEIQENDLSVIGLEVPVSAVRGERIPVTVTVRNAGPGDLTAPVVITLLNQSGGRVIGTRPLEEVVKQGETRSFTYSWNTAEVQSGQVILEARHDHADPDRSNNRMTATVAINQPAENDLAVTSLDAPLRSIRGDEVTVVASVENLSWRDVTEPVEVVLMEGESEIGREIREEGVKAGEQFRVGWRWDTGETEAGVRTLTARLLHEDENGDNNLRSTSVQIEEPKPYDLAVTTIVAREEIVRGERVPVLVYVRNVGLNPVTGGFDLFLTNYSYSREIGRHTWNGVLAPGDSLSFSYDWNSSEVLPGNVVLVATHSLADDNSANNLRTRSVRVGEEDLMDIGITGISLDPEISRGDVVNVSVAVQNLGNQNIGRDIHVTFFNETDQVEIDSEIIRGGLARDNSITLAFVWDTTGSTIRTHTLVVRHDLEDDVSSNNSMSNRVRIREPEPTPPPSAPGEISVPSVQEEMPVQGSDREREPGAEQERERE